VEATTSLSHYGVSFQQIFHFPTNEEERYPESISDMIKQLPESLQRLVDNIETLVTETEATQCLQLQQPIRLEGKGGYPGRASYGWILQIGDTKIAQGNGPAYGDDPRSFQAEGYGMASALLYLHLLQRQTDFTQEK
jgi:hypothetical protein